MQAYRLLLETAKTQESQLVACAAFDAAWAEIQSQFPADGPGRDEARCRLASAMLPFVNEEVADPIRLKKLALHAMQSFASP